MTKGNQSSIAKTGGGFRADRLVIASNRLPTRLEITSEGVVSHTSSGGLASALSGFRSTADFSWVGWPGCVIPADREAEVEERLHEQQLGAVFLSETQEENYYRGFCNQVLWPLFHYCTDRMTFDEHAWKSYVEVNRMFTEAILERCGTDGRVWIHDFHLMLVPSMLRERAPHLEIGFFLHIPFPSSEIYRLLPTRTEILHGLLGADYIGFHTSEYARHFRSACLRVLGLESDPGSIRYEGRRVGIGTHGIGVDVDGFRATKESDECAQLYAELEQRYRGKKIILGIERLDYTKGIPLKLQAFERLLQRDRQRAQDTTLVQVLVPSRLDHPDYRSLKSEIEEAVGRINGEYSRPGSTPIEYLHRNLSPEQLVAMYRLADVCLVSPVRDGMNLVAQEFVLCQEAEGPGDPYRGILVLSEFAGAAHYLSRSILINPWSIDETAQALQTALCMSPHEKRERMATMAEQVAEMNCQGWAGHFLEKMSEAHARAEAMVERKRLMPDDNRALHDRFVSADRRLLALDYDGTLRELMRSPGEAAPTEEILSLLTRLAAMPNTEVHLISGRPRDTMQQWFGDLPIHLCAEHGFAARALGGEWDELHKLDLSWMDEVEETLRRVCHEVPGTLVESKSCALAWHYRMADLDYGEWRARELLSTLEENLANAPVEVLPGHRVIEVRATGVHKGRYLSEVLAAFGPDSFVLCAGDDRTDMDMYRVLPDHAISIHVGAGGGEGDYTVESPTRLRAVLTGLECALATTADRT